MALSVGNQTVSATTGSTSCSLPLGAGVVVGDRLYAFIAIRTTGVTITAPDATWFIISAQRTQSAHVMALFYHDMVAGDAGPFVFSWGGANVNLASALVPIHGNGAICHVGVTASDAVSDGTCVVPAASTTTRTGLLLDCSTLNRGNSTLTANDSFTALAEADAANVNGVMLRCATKAVTSATAPATSFTAANASTSIGAQVQIWEDFPLVRPWTQLLPH